MKAPFVLSSASPWPHSRLLLPSAASVSLVGVGWKRNAGLGPGCSSKVMPGRILIPARKSAILMMYGKVESYLSNAGNSNGSSSAGVPSGNTNGSLSAGVPGSNGVSPGVAGSQRKLAGLDPFRGKLGSVSFCGLSYEKLEEGKLMSSPFKEGTGSVFWVVGPLALIVSLIIPQFVLGGVFGSIIQDDILAEIVTSFSSEVIFYLGLSAFLSVIDHVQRPYLDYSPKRWSLITGLKGFLSSAFFTMGLKVFAPILAVYVVWPVIGFPAVIAVAPFLVGCAVQYAFEIQLQKRNSSCWPVLPIIFEIYRLYQLNKGAHFIERMLFTMKETSSNPAIMEMSNALVSMLAVFQILGIVCMWSLATFLLRLFPSRPVAENY